MSFRHTMTCFTEGIRATLPARWRSFNGMIGVHWQASGAADARGYYLSPDPRIMIFFNDVSGHIRLTNRAAGVDWRPMTRAVYVPAGMPMWTNFTAAHNFSHLDLHLHRDRLLRFLAPSVGESVALSAIRAPAEIQDARAVEMLANLFVGELDETARHGVFAENLAGGIVSGLLEIPSEEPEAPASGGLTPAQMGRLVTRLEQSREHRLSVAEMADAVGLSESWFAAAFKKTTGKAPHQWQVEQRVLRAQGLLRDSDLRVADIAAQLGFADQAHLTRAFRQVAGATPAAWRRMQRLP